MLVWSKGNIKKTVCVTVLLTVIMVYKDKTRVVLTGWSTTSGFDLAWFISLSSECLCIFDLHGAICTGIFLVTSFSLPVCELSLV